ncbi:MAG: trimeric intracellular cation channel family protein [Gaiellaceae bacterium]
MAPLHSLLASDGTVTFFKGWDFTGNYTLVDLVAASTNALNGALLARRPDHFKNFTIVGILCMALLGGLGGGITRDVLLGDVPSALTNPAYITLALAFGLLGYSIAYAKGQLFREGIFQFMTSFSLPWYAIVGAQKGVGAGIPILGCMFLAVVGPTAGRWYIDLSSGVTPKQFIRGEWFVSIAALTGLVWILTFWASGNTWIALGVAFVIGFTVRVLCLWYAWEEPLAKEPTGVYQHSDGRPMLGRKLKGKSRRELRDLGLLVENHDQSSTVSAGVGTE